MKLFKFLSVLLFTLTLSLASNSQKGELNFNAHMGTNSTRLVGLDLYGKLGSGLVLGVGGTHASTTFFTSLEADGYKFSHVGPNPSSTVNWYRTKVEDRGSVSGLLGYGFKSTAVMVESGIAFQQNIDFGYTAPTPPPAGSQAYYKSRPSSKFLYGGLVTQKLSGRLGLLAGYNNVQKFKFGINYRITPSKMFNW